MCRPSRQAAVVGCFVVAGAVSVSFLALRSHDRVIALGFWFEPVTIDASIAGGLITPADLDVIESIARKEIVGAFEGLQVLVSERLDATYRVRVVQEIRDRRLRREVHVAGESRAFSGPTAPPRRKIRHRPPPRPGWDGRGVSGDPPVVERSLTQNRGVGCSPRMALGPRPALRGRRVLDDRFCSRESLRHEFSRTCHHCRG